MYRDRGCGILRNIDDGSTCTNQVLWVRGRVLLGCVAGLGRPGPVRWVVRLLLSGGPAVGCIG